MLNYKKNINHIQKENLIDQNPVYVPCYPGYQRMLQNHFNKSCERDIGLVF